jgi:hypothetical protein
MPGGEGGALLDAVGGWVARRPDVVAVALVGSWARGAAGPGSDVDLVVLTESPALYVAGEEWARELGAARVVLTRRWGVLVERRLAMPGGLEVDVGFVLPSWASVDPVDAGTVRVVGDGLVPLHDPAGVLARLIDSVASGR